MSRPILNPPKLGLTEREKAIWPPRKEIDGLKVMEWCFWLALALVLIATLMHFTIEPSGESAVSKTMSQLSDRQQEQKYCAEWATQKVPVYGGSTDAIRTHCANYL